MPAFWSYKNAVVTTAWTSWPMALRSSQYADGSDVVTATRPAPIVFFWLLAFAVADGPGFMAIDFGMIGTSTWGLVAGCCCAPACAPAADAQVIRQIKTMHDKVLLMGLLLFGQQPDAGTRPRQPEFACVGCRTPGRP